MPKMTFEKALDQLEQIVRDMESGELNLESALKKFEEGMKLSKYCSEKLDETEKKISLLMGDGVGGEVSESPFEFEEPLAEDDDNHLED